MHRLKSWDSIWWLLLFELLLVTTWAVPCPPSCSCQDHSLQCSNLTSTSVLQSSHFSNIKSLTLTQCSFTDGCLKSEDFSQLPSLHKLTITGSNLKKFPCHPAQSKVLLQSLRTLDLSQNQLEELDISFLVKLFSLNVSHNRVSSLHSQTFQKIRALKKLDLSHNFLTDTQVLKSLSPPSLKYLDISSNPWPCSPSVSWLYAWSRPLVSSGALRNTRATHCHLAGSKRAHAHSPLLVAVARVYSESVAPMCHKGCSCKLNYWADLKGGGGEVEYNVANSEVEYNVAVNCSGLGLTVFPKLPEHTKKLDLSNNSLSSSSYEKLDVVEDNYERVQYLNISHNNLNSISNKFLKIMLKTEFIATHNQLTNIPYDFSKHLQKNTNKILLGNNPWICGCNAEIKMLKDKIKDLKNIFCGLGSVPESINQKQLISIEEMVLCPPEDDGSLREVLLQLLCVILAILIILVLAKLVYDFWVYRNRGKLPWIVLKMP